MAQPVGRVMNDVAPQSAAAPSPFPPIADYAFLSNCHTGALVAPDGLVVYEHARRAPVPDSAGSLVLTRDLVSGDSALAFYACRP